MKSLDFDYNLLAPRWLVVCTKIEIPYPFLHMYDLDTDSVRNKDWKQGCPVDNREISKGCLQYFQVVDKAKN